MVCSEYFKRSLHVRLCSLATGCHYFGPARICDSVTRRPCEMVIFQQTVFDRRRCAANAFQSSLRSTIFFRLIYCLLFNKPAEYWTVSGKGFYSVCVGDAVTLLLVRMRCFFLLSSYSVFHRICDCFSSLETSVIDLKLLTQYAQWSQIAFQHFFSVTYNHKITAVLVF